MSEPAPADLVLHGARVVTVDPALGEIADAVIVVRDGRFAQIGPRDASRPLPAAHR